MSGDINTTAQNADLMAEGLVLAVPLWMAKLDAKARRNASERRTYAQLVRRYGTEMIENGVGKYPATTVPANIATAGDLLFARGDRPGEAANLFNALARGLAALALISPDGATYRGHHWCRAGKCGVCQKSGAE